MAIIGGQDEDENQKTLPTSSTSPNAHAATDAAAGVPYGSAGGGFIGGGGVQGATTGVASAQPIQPAAGGGGYANLQQYLAANQDTGATTGQAAENVVQQAGNAATGAQQAYGTGAKNDISAATTAVGSNADTLKSISGGAALTNADTLAKIKAGAYAATPDQKSLDAIAGAQNESKVDAKSLQSLIDQGASAKAASAYGGPTDFSSVVYGGPSMDKVAVSYGGPTSTGGFTGQTAADQADFSQKQGVLGGYVQNAQGGHSGVSALLQKAYQQPGYSKGENNLDAFLAGGTQGGQAALGQAAGIGQGVSDSYANLNSLLSGQIATGQQTAKDTNAAYQRAIEDAQGTSAASLASYNDAVAQAKAAGAANQKAALDAAAKAQAEKDREAAWDKAHPAPAEEDKSFLGQLQSKIDSGLQKVLPKVIDGGGKVVEGLDKISNPNLKGALPTSASVTSTAKNAAGSVKQAANTTKQVATQAKNAVVTPVANAVKSGAKDVGNSVANVFHGGWAYGGKVPDYSKLRAMLKR